jgi:hypothetical protein
MFLSWKRGLLNRIVAAEWEKAVFRGLVHPAYFVDRNVTAG